MMRNKISSNSFQTTILFLLILVSSFCLMSIEASTTTCRHNSGRIKGKNPHSTQCNHHQEDHNTHHQVSSSHHIKGILTLNSFEKGGSGGAPSECDSKFHSDNTLVVALSTSQFMNRKRCLKSITIFGNGRKVNAVVVDECDSRKGCPNNVVDASKAVWEALGVPKKDWGRLNIFWSDA